MPRSTFSFGKSPHKKQIASIMGKDKGNDPRYRHRARVSASKLAERRAKLLEKQKLIAMRKGMGKRK